MAIIINNMNDSIVTIIEDKYGNTVVTIGGKTTADHIVESWNQLALPNSQLSKFFKSTFDIKRRR